MGEWCRTPPSQVTYATDVVNQYTQIGGTARTHDNNGNLTDDGTYLFVLRLREPAGPAQEQVHAGGDRHVSLRRAGATGREGGRGWRDDAVRP